MRTFVWIIYNKDEKRTKKHSAFALLMEINGIGRCVKALIKIIFISESICTIWNGNDKKFFENVKKCLLTLKICKLVLGDEYHIWTFIQKMLSTFFQKAIEDQ